MSDTFTVTASGDPLIRSLAFMEAWRDASAEADIDIRGGATTAGVAGLCLTLNGTHHAFTANECRTLVEVIESAIRAYPKESRKEGLPNLAKGIKKALRRLQPN